jgi:cytidine deaminase
MATARMLDQADWDTLAAAARDASRQAYCPYSRYAVGAAARTADGRIFTGCNVENASFGLSICAERNAIFHAVASGARDLVALVVYTPTAQPASPCGACRQVIVEFGAAQVMACCDGAATTRWNAAELLPGAFSLDRKA